MYEGTAPGYENGNITVFVTIEAGQIKSIDVVSHDKQTEPYWSAALDVRDAIVEKKTTDVDAVTGATLSSDGIKNAVSAALVKAAGQAVATEPQAEWFAGGKGTKEDPYQIANEEQLRYIAKAINEDTSWKDVYFLQTADITLSEEEWLPIGYIIQGYYRSRYTEYASYPFNGNFDGGGYSVTGLRIGTDKKATDDPRMQSTAGFFGYTKGTVTTNYRMDIVKQMNPDAASLEIRNVNLKDVSINTGFTSTNYAGGLVGYNNRSTVFNAYATGDVSSSAPDNRSYTGGFAGYGGGVHFNTFAAGNVTTEKAFANMIWYL